MMRKGEREEGRKGAVWSKVYAPGPRGGKDLLSYAARRVCVRVCVCVCVFVRACVRVCYKHGEEERVYSERYSTSRGRGPLLHEQTTSPSESIPPRPLWDLGALLPHY
jgi:hypothetical protein